MKQIKLLLVLFLFSAPTAFAQSIEYLNNCSKQNLKELPAILKYENSGGEKGISFFEFDGNKLLRKGHWELLDKSRSSMNYYFYNKEQQLTEFYREFSDSLTGSIKFGYNENGKLQSETFSRSDGVNGTSNYHYDENGILEKIIANKLKGWFSGEIVFETDNNLHPQRAFIYSKGKKVGLITFTYDGEKLIKEYWDFPGKWNQTFEWVYMPAEKLCTSSNVFIEENSRFRLIKENYDFNNETGGPSHYSYDKDGCLTEKIFIRSDSLRTVTTYNYNDDGSLQSSSRKYNDGRQGVFTYEWTRLRKLKSRTLSIDNQLISIEKYFYTDTGQLTQAEWNNFDSWLNGNITFDYSQNGQISKGHFIGKNNFNAEIIFSYDQDSNLSQIQWIFSTGKTQTYWFEYEKLY